MENSNELRKIAVLRRRVYASAAVLAVAAGLATPYVIRDTLRVNEEQRQAHEKIHPEYRKFDLDRNGHIDPLEINEYNPHRK